MRLITFSAIVAFSTAILFSSCKKDYKCECKSAWTQQWYDHPLTETSRHKAYKECQSFVAPEVDGPTECRLH